MKVGDVVGGRYQVEELIGAGGMGSVWRARHLVTDKRVALKILLGDDAQARARFLREARAACVVEHENVVAVHDVLEAEDGTPVMVMDLLRGETLRERLAREGRLSEADTLRILAPVVSAVATAHARGVIHRDLKPENIFLTSGGSVKVLDFGIAKILKDTTLSSSTASGVVLGTVLYMAPEQAFGDAVDHRADTWAIGVILYEALAGQLPIRGDSAGQVFRELADPKIVPLDSCAADVTPKVAKLCGRMLSLDPAGRPELDEVGRIFEELGYPAVAVASAGPLPAKRGPDAPRLALWAAVLVTLGGAAYGWSKTSASRAPPAELVASAPASASATSPDAVVRVSTVPAAEAAYRDAVAALRGSDWPRARAGFEKALSLDPECAAAAVQMLMMMRYDERDQRIEYYRGLYRMADSNKSRLSARDVALLDAVQPWVMREPPNAEEMQKRLDAAAEAFPNDAQTVFYAVLASESPEVHLRGADRTLELDPGYLDAMQIRARVLDRLDRTPEAIAQLDTCVKQSPASQCAGDNIILRLNTGDCAGAERAARSWVADGAGINETYEFYSVALAGNGAEPKAVEEALRQMARTSPPELAAYLQPVAQAHLEVRDGHFAAAKERAKALLAAIDGRPDANPHDEAAGLWADILYEIGTRAEAEAAAESYFPRQKIWSRGSSLGRGALGLILALDATGGIAHDEALRRAEAWRQEEAARALNKVHVELLATLVARTKEEAAAFPALDAPFAGVRMTRRALRAQAARGHLDLVAGRTDAAIGRLEEATKSCAVLLEPFLWVRSHLWLGQAYELRKDKESACKAYGVVLARWGVEQPLGRTAAEAKKRMAALECK